MKSSILEAKYFESQDPDEKVILVVRKHPLVLAYSFLAGGMIAISLLVLYFTFRYLNVISGEEITALAGLLVYFFILYTLLFTFNGWLVKYLDILILTTKHLVVIRQEGLFKRGVSVLDLGAIQDVAIKQTGILQTLFGFGQIVIQTAGEIPNFVYSGVANPSNIQDSVMDAKSKLSKKNHLTSAKKE